MFTTLDPQAQQVARDGLAGPRRLGRRDRARAPAGCGRWSSIPGYDPNEIPDRFGDLRRAPGSPLLDRAVQSGYPPGSTFKVVTATAALDSGEYTPNSVVDGRSPKRIGGVPLANFGNEDFGPITLTTALTNSVNTVWARGRARSSARARCSSTCDRYGFDRKPLIDLPADEMRASGVYGRNGKLLGAVGRDRHRPRRDRPGAAAGDSAPDGAGRGRRSRTAAA